MVFGYMFADWFQICETAGLAHSAFKVDYDSQLHLNIVQHELWVDTQISKIQSTAACDVVQQCPDHRMSMSI